VGTTAIYCRISKDREGRAEGVETQEQRGRHYATQHWPDQPVAVYSDNDLTAADPNVARPGYQQMLAAIRRAEIAQVVCAEQSRLTRQPAEWEHLAVTLARAGIREVHCYRTGVVEVAGSKLVGRILAAVNAEEVETLKARITDRLDSLAAQGRPHGGTPYAYRHVAGPDGRRHLEVVAERAAVVTEAAERILSGWSLSAVAADLAGRGVATARGGRWTASTVKSLLTNPTVAGLRTHRGRLGEGTWEPVLDRDTYRRLQAVLAAPVVLSTDRGVYRALRSRQASRRRYLLTGGVARCAICLAPLAAQQRQNRDGSRTPIYACHPSTGGRCCVSILAVPLEAHVADRLCVELDRPGFWDAYSADDHSDERDGLLSSLSGILERRGELAVRWAAGEVSGGEWDMARRVLDSEEARLRVALDRLPSTVQPIDGGLLREAWKRAELGERRRYVDLFVGSVTVGRGRPGVRRFDPGRVQISFR
jgi:DNA invertase Pin-like site-specific DNA recombinase